MVHSKFPVLHGEYVDFVEVGNDDFIEVTSVEQHVVEPTKVNHFIEANTNEVSYEHLQNDCIVPSFATMEETISHQQFIGAVVKAAHAFFPNEQFTEPEIRVSHPINGRIPSALGKKASELTDDEKSLFYQRMCFCEHSFYILIT